MSLVSIIAENEISLVLILFIHFINSYFTKKESLGSSLAKIILPASSRKRKKCLEINKLSESIIYNCVRCIFTELECINVKKKGHLQSNTARETHFNKFLFPSI